MFEVEIDRTFSAAHQLRGYRGDCCNLHGHNYKVTVTVRSAVLDEIGIAVDFRRLKAELDSLLTGLDHKFLNDLPAFGKINPTSENRAKFIYERMSAKMNGGSVKVWKVRVGESETSAVTYFED